MTPTWIRLLFVIAALYDGLLGLGFLFFTPVMFDLAHTPPPSHLGYVQFPAALLLVFAILFTQIAISPVRYRGLIVYGMLLKVSYSGVVFFHSVAQGVPLVWLLFAVLDLVFLALFAVARFKLAKAAKDAPAAA